MPELTPLAAAQAEVDEVSGILKENLGKVSKMEKCDEWMGRASLDESIWGVLYPKMTGVLRCLKGMEN